MAANIKLYRVKILQKEDCRRQSTFQNVKDFRRQLPSHGVIDFSQNSSITDVSEHDDDESESASSFVEPDRVEEDTLTEKETELPATTIPPVKLPTMTSPKVFGFMNCPDIDFVHVCFFFLNIFFLLTGTLIFSLGVLVVTNIEEVSAVTKSVIPGRLANVDFAGLLQQGSTGFIVGGVCTVFVGCLGVLGMCTGSKAILFTYGLLIIVGIGAEFSGCLYFIIFRNDIFSDIKAALLKAMRTDYDGMINSSSLFSQSLDTMHVYFQCCGINGWRDFSDTPWFYQINNLPEPTTTTEPPCIWVTVYQNISSTTTEEIFDDNVTRTTTLRPVLTTCIYNITTTTTVAPENTTLSRTRLRTFPTSCCKTVKVSVLDVASETGAQLMDPDCPYKNASVSNPNTILGCFESIKTFLFSQIAVILSLIFTIVGLEVSAVSNTYSVIKDLKRKKEKAKLFSNTSPFVSALTGINPSSAPPGPGDSGSSKKESPPETVENEFQSNLTAFIGGEVMLPLEDGSISPEASTVAAPVQPMLMMGPTGELTVVTLPTAAQGV